MWGNVHMHSPLLHDLHIILYAYPLNYVVIWGILAQTGYFMISHLAVGTNLIIIFYKVILT